jgi:hypothetical protein
VPDRRSLRISCRHLRQPCFTNASLAAQRSGIGRITAIWYPQSLLTTTATATEQRRPTTRSRGPSCLKAAAVPRPPPLPHLLSRRTRVSSHMTTRGGDPPLDRRIRRRSRERYVGARRMLRGSGSACRRGGEICGAQGRGRMFEWAAPQPSGDAFVEDHRGGKGRHQGRGSKLWCRPLHPRATPANGYALWHASNVDVRRPRDGQLMAEIAGLNAAPTAPSGRPTGARPGARVRV